MRISDWSSDVCSSDLRLCVSRSAWRGRLHRCFRRPVSRSDGRSGRPLAPRLGRLPFAAPLRNFPSPYCRSSRGSIHPSVAALRRISCYALHTPSGNLCLRADEPEIEGGGKPPASGSREIPALRRAEERREGKEGGRK